MQPPGLRRPSDPPPPANPPYLSNPLGPPIVAGPAPAVTPEPRTTAEPAVVVRRPRWVTPVFAAMIAATIAALSFASWSLAHRNGGDPGPSSEGTAGGGPTLRDAHRACHWRGDLSDGGRTLYLDMKGKEPGTGTLSWQHVQCYLEALEAPEYIVRQMQSTRALDGRQSDTWGSFEASWTYHPNHGLDVLIRQLG